MQLSSLKDKKIVIFGFGREGQATFDVLKARGFSVVVTDEKAVEIPEFVGLDALTADANTVVIKSPGIPPHHDALHRFTEQGARIISATNIFFAERKGRGLLIGVTGTKGKSTTSSLLAHVLQTAGKPVKLVGNIGSPSIAEIDAPDETVFVIELSSYQLSDLATAPDIGIIINLYEEHMDWHGSVAAYYAAKLRLGELMSESDVLVYNEAFPQLVDLAKRTKAKTLPFAEENAVLDRLTLLGAHNRENARGVLAVCDHLGVDREIVGNAFTTFTALPHRLEDVGAVDNVTFINDSISTTPQSALAAIAAFEGRLGGIILGGHDRGYDFSELAAKLAKLGTYAVVMPGGDRLLEALTTAGVHAERVADLGEAVAKTKAAAKPGQVVLLSPASPSYGQFKNFEERGEKFREAVKSTG